MLTILITTLSASLIGSVHCAGMCGPFAVAATVPLTVGGRGMGAPGMVSRAMPTAAYHVGRVVCYAVLGAMAGLLGKGLDLGASLAGVQRGAAWIAGITMIGVALAVLARHAGVSVPRGGAPACVRGWIGRGHALAASRGPLVRALVIGLLTSLLPCGWLYSFVVIAAGTGDAWLGTLVMLAFWAGTVPALVLVGLGVPVLLAPVRRALPVATAMVLLGLGVLQIAGKMGVAVSGGTGVATPGAVCHGP